MNRWTLILVCAVAAIAASATSQTLKIEGGAISGAASATPGVHEYKGVPYAAPPLNDLRWKPPAPVVA